MSGPRSRRPRSATVAAGAALACLLAPPAGARAAPEPAPAPPPQTGPAAPPAEAEGTRAGASRIEQVGPGRYRFSGDVDIRKGGLRLQADEVEYDERTQECRARGRVVMEEGPLRITGEVVDVNLETRRATILDAYAEMEPDLIIEAERMEKVADDRYRLKRARLSSCTQPVPYWSLRVGSGTLHLDHYIGLRNLRLEFFRVPVFYTPYLIWPVKEDRASGLLIPQIGYSERRGTVINNALFWAPARNFDTTFYLDYLEQDGLGVGLESRWLPTQNGRASFTGYYLDEEILDPDTGEPEGTRYRYRMSIDQKLPRGWRVLGDLNEVSDFDYYLDFERDLRKASSPTNLSTLDVSRSWSFYTLNVRGERREQLLAGDAVLRQQRQPEVELRARSRQLGGSPFYLAFEASAAALRREASYGRFDFFPTLRAPLRPAPWLEITPSLSARETLYTRQADPSGAAPALDDALRRDYVRADVDLLGPRFSRVFDTPESGFSPRLKNVIEPRVTYTYVPDQDEIAASGSPVLIFDEIDSLQDDIHAATYSLTSRWFALRGSGDSAPALSLPRHMPLPGLAPEAEVGVEEPPTPPEEVAAGALPPGAAPAAEAEPAGPPAPAARPARGLSPFEFISFTLSQSFGFNRPLSSRDTDGDGVLDQFSDHSPVNASLRINPTSRHSLNLTASYDILRRTVESATLSTDLRGRDSLLSLTWFIANREALNQNQLRLSAGTSLFGRKVTLALATETDIEARRLRDQRYRVGYNTQCCGFLVEYLNRDFSASQEREVRLLVNLKGVGTILDLQQGVR
jgi:lipopolysaccharide assembly outer membrane protein LptD (OstA)